MLTPLLKQTQAEIDKLTAELEQAGKDLQECEESAERELHEYKQIRTWADLYKTCSHEEKKMIVSRFIRRLYVYRDYRLEVEFNVSFEDFKRLTVMTDEAPNPGISGEITIRA